MSSSKLEIPEPSKAALRHARALQRRRYRQETGQFLVEGRQAVREALKAPGVVESLYVRWDAAFDNADLLEQAGAAGVPYFALSEQNLATVTDTVTPQGVVAVAHAVDVPLSELAAHPALVVICAQVRDPGNAGTVIRCADAFGADAVIVSSDSVDVYNPKVVRATVGSLFHLPLVVDVGLADAVGACRERGLQVFGADGHADTDLAGLGGDLARPTAWLMGNESWGLPAASLDLVDKSVSVPMYGRAESLNLAAAAAVCLYASASAVRSNEK